MREAAEAREAAERAALEAAERAERERLRREAREAERAERVRVEQETREVERERVRREASELAATTRISVLEAMLEERLTREAKDIKEAEERLQSRKENLQSRKRSLLEAVQSMPQEAQARISLGDDYAQEAAGNNSICVICQDQPAIMAVVPCGHVCLCPVCSDVCLTDRSPCPLCRGNLQSMLKLYFGRRESLNLDL